MDLDKALIYSLVKEGRDAYHRARNKGVDPLHLSEEGKTLLSFVSEFLKDYGSLPTIDHISGKTGIDIGSVEGPSDFFASEVLNRHLHLRLKEGLDAPSSLLAARKPQEAYQALEALLRELRKEKAVGSQVESLVGLMPDVVAYYDKIKSGERGIVTPWEIVNEDTFGFWPEDLIIFAARTSIGKSWCMLLLAECAWAAKKRVLFATTEMSKQRIALRFASLQFKLDYDSLRKGRLWKDYSQKVEDDFRKKAKEIEHAEGIYVVGGDFDFRVESLEAAIDESRPDIVFMDGAYLLKMPGHNRTEQVANAFNEMKRTAKSKKVPMVVTSQFNREAKANVVSSAKLEHMALSDVAGWNADLVYALIQTEEMKQDRKMLLKSLKAREGVGMEVLLNWDLSRTDFSEVPKDAGGGGGTWSAGGVGGADDSVPF